MEFSQAFLHIRQSTFFLTLPQILRLDAFIEIILVGILEFIDTDISEPPLRYLLKYKVCELITGLCRQLLEDFEN